MSVTSSQIRAALKARITEALDLFYDNANSAVNPKVIVNVYGNWVLAHRLGESAAALRVTTGRDEGKIHTWMIGNGQVDRSRPELHKDSLLASANRGILKTAGSNRRDNVKRFKVWAYLEYDEALAIDEDPANAENVLAAEVEYVANYLSKFPKLGITNDNNCLQGHGELQTEDQDTISYGENILSLAFNYIDVVVFSNVN